MTSGVRARTVQDVLPAHLPLDAVRGCGCEARPLWRCDLCCDTGVEYLACSRPCLARHQRRHPDGEVPMGQRLVRRQRENNRAHEANWAAFSAHRERLTGLLRALQRGEGLCVLGAGNGDDLDLPALVREFGEVHLVDLDGAALARARARVPAAQAHRVVLHGDVDLTGVLGHLDEDEAGDDRLAAWLEAGRRAVLARLGRTFDVVLSSALASQLCVPLYRVLARRPHEWEALMAAVGRAHADTLIELARPGGTAVWVGEAFYARAGAPAAPSWSAPDPAIFQALGQGFMRLRDPRFVAHLLDEPVRRGRIEAPRLTEPWLWRVEGALMLVYAILFRRS